MKMVFIFRDLPDMVIKDN